MITVKQKGDFNKLDRFLYRACNIGRLARLDTYGQQGVEALKKATPVDSGVTQNKWDYKIVQEANGYAIQFSNSNFNDGVSIAIILQYGHGTRNGGYVQGRDYINPALRPVFDKMADFAWKEVNAST